MFRYAEFKNKVDVYNAYLQLHKRGIEVEILSIFGYYRIKWFE